MLVAALEVVGVPLAMAVDEGPAPGASEPEHGPVTINLLELARRRATGPILPGARRLVPAPMPPAGWPVVFEGGNRSEPAPLPLGRRFGSAGSSGTFTPQLNTNFLALIDDHTANPPDTQGAVGPNHLMVTLNSEVAIQTRQGPQTAPGPYLLKTSLADFWSNLGYDSLYDPRVVYDPLADRWVTIVLADPNTTNSALLIAASASADPTGNWNELAIPVNPAPGLTNQVWADYPNLGFNGRWVVVTVNLYGVATNSFVRAEIFALDQQRLFGGTFSYARFSDQYFFNVVPATTFDPGETNLYFVTEFGTSNLRLTRLTGAVGQEQYRTNGLVTATVDPWVFSPGNTNFLPQFGTNLLISGNDSRIQTVTMRHGTLWCDQTVFLPLSTNVTHSAVQWWQLATNAAILQRGRIEDTNAVMNYAFPSLAVNQNNDVLIGYSSFSSNRYASADYAYRLGGDPTNTLRPDVILKAGLAPFVSSIPASTTNQTATPGQDPDESSGGPENAGSNRWGDFSATVVDPLNDIDLWTIQEYAETPDAGGDRWGTWWGQLVFQPPTPPGNDNLTNALPLPNAIILGGVSASATGSNADGSLEPAEPQIAQQPGGHSVWWTWTAPTNGPVTITTDGSNFDTLLGVFTGLGLSNLTEVAADDDSGTNLASRVTFAATQGTTYAIVVDGYAGQQGNVQLSLTMNPPDWPPAVSLLTPTNGTVVIETGTITLNANAADADGTVTRVEFVLGKTNLAVLTNAPYTLAWTNVPVGNYALYARAWDDHGLGASSAIADVRVVPTNFPPVATITSPTNGAVFSAPATVNLEVDATDPDGSVTNLQLFSGTTKIASAGGAPALFTLTVPSPSAYTLWAVAVDDQGATSAPVTLSFIVRPGNDAFTNAVPLTGARVTTNGSNLAATKEPGEPNHAGDAGGQSVWWSWTAPTNGLATVSIFGSTFESLLGVYTGNSLTNLSVVASNQVSGSFAGSVNFAALDGAVYQIAVDGARNTNGVVAAGDIALNISLVPSNLPPAVALLSPTNQATFNAPASIPISASATGVDAPISTVVLVVGGTNQLRQLTTPPYSFLWTNVPAGTYVLTARATDTLGVTTASSPVTVTVAPRAAHLAGATGAAHGPFVLTLTGEPALEYGLETSTNLDSWTALTNLVITANGTVGFVDPASTNLRTRFYRAVLNRETP